MKKLLLDTNVCGRLASVPYKDDLSRIKSRISRVFKLVVSPQTLSELLDGLRKSTDAHFEEHKQRFKVMAFGNSPIFLPFPATFALEKVLSLTTPQIKFGPKDFRYWFDIVIRSRSRQQLVDGLVVRPLDLRKTYGISPDVIHDQLNEGKRVHRERLENQRSNRRPFPSRAAWARQVADDLGHTISPAQATRLGEALDAAYCYESALRNVVADGKYKFAKHDGDWIDYHQLLYLCDPEIGLVTDDRAILSRIVTSKQKDRVFLLRDFLTSLGFTPRH